MPVEEERRDGILPTLLVNKRGKRYGQESVLGGGDISWTDLVSVHIYNYLIPILKGLVI